MPLETRISAINLTIPQREPRTLDVDTERWLIDNFALIRENLLTLRADVDLLNLIVPELVPAGYGGMEISSPPVASADIPAGATNWLPITFYDNIDIIARGCVVDDVAGTILINPAYTGVWEVIFNASISHDDINSGRTVNLRLFNVTDAVQVGASIEYAIGRNQPGTNIALPFLATVAPAQTNKAIRFEIGEASTVIQTVSWNFLTFDAHFAGELASLSNPTP